MILMLASTDEMKSRGRKKGKLR